MVPARLRFAGAFGCNHRPTLDAAPAVPADHLAPTAGEAGANRQQEENWETEGGAVRGERAAYPVSVNAISGRPEGRTMS